MIASVSGVRGILNDDMTLADVARFAGNFAALTGSAEVLLARDTRNTGPVMSRAVSGAIVGEGASVVDFGVISTPALFRESLLRKRPAVMVTASHNEPQYNGLKFIVDGRGATKESFDSIVSGHKTGGVPLGGGVLRKAQRSRYVDDLVKRFGEGSCEGVRVALDLGGGAAIAHAVPLFRRLGCAVTSLNDSFGVFSRRIDPTADDLSLLRKAVKSGRCDIGLGFDCDGDRLVIVDSQGTKRSGDYMLSLALARLLHGSNEECVVVSTDTTQAIDIVAGKAGAKVVRTKVGEANVVSGMTENGARLGGEGSSGGLIDSSFNFCRDSMLAALVIIRALKQRGESVYGEVESFSQNRVALKLQRAKAARAIKMLASQYKGSDTTDGVKVWVSRHSWVLVRASGTEDLVRVSAEAATARDAERIASEFSAELKELCR